MAKGSEMKSWSAAFRSWCLNATRFNPTGVRSTIVPRAATAEAADPSDPYGCRAWASTLPDTIPETDYGRPVLCLGGFDVVGVAHDLCRAVGLPIDWRGDLSPIAEWLRSGIDSETIMDAVRSAKPPREPGLWQYYDRRVRERGRREEPDGALKYMN